LSSRLSDAACLVEKTFEPGVYAPQAIDHRTSPLEVLSLSFDRPTGWRRRSNVTQVAYLVGQFYELRSSANVRRVLDLKAFALCFV